MTKCISFAIAACLLAQLATSQPLSNCSIGIIGDTLDFKATTQVGFVLAGGSTDVDEAFQWMIRRSGGGDFVVIRASGSTGYNDYIFGLGKLNSVETLLIDSREKAMSKAVGDRIREAEALFIAGGDQWNYMNFWSNSEVSEAIAFLIDKKKVPVGGTSAGAAILSGFVFDARHGSARSEIALQDPYDSTVSISKSFIKAPFLEETIADQHYSQRGRHGRHVVFMARIMKERGIRHARGIGVDEKTAVCIDEEGMATIFGLNNAYFLFADTQPGTVAPGIPLNWNGKKTALRVAIYRGSAAGTLSFNLRGDPRRTDEIWFVEDGTLRREEPR